MKKLRFPEVKSLAQGLKLGSGDWPLEVWLQSPYSLSHTIFSPCTDVPNTLKWHPRTLLLLTRAWVPSGESATTSRRWTALKLLSRAESQPLAHASSVPAEGHEHTFGSQNPRDPALLAALYSDLGPCPDISSAQPPSLSLRGRVSLSLRCCFWTLPVAGLLAPCTFPLLLLRTDWSSSSEPELRSMSYVPGS